MPVVAGRIVRPDDTIEGWLRVEGGRVVEAGEGAPEERPAATGWVVPAPINAHTHLGDTALRDAGPKPHGLAELVGPGGWKHQQLARLTREAKAAGIARALGEMAAVGTQSFVDFREGGVYGATVLREAVEADGRAAARILGRPEGPGDDALDAVLAVADGLGIPSVEDLGWREAERWAEAAHSRRRWVGLHVSEGRREDIAHALALEPHLVVHACQATRGDLDQIAAARIPAVVCPRSNRFFGLRPQVPAMLEAGIQVALGTDNGMLHDANVLEEAKLLHAWHPKLSIDVILRLATHNGRAAAGLPTLRMRKGDDADLVVLPDAILVGGDAGKPGFAV